MRCAVKGRSPSDEGSAGDRHATFCGNQEREAAPGDPVAVRGANGRRTVPSAAGLFGPQLAQSHQFFGLDCYSTTI